MSESEVVGRCKRCGGTVRRVWSYSYHPSNPYEVNVTWAFECENCEEPLLWEEIDRP